MIPIKTVPFAFEGKLYDIRVVLDNDTYRVRVFLDNKPANGYEYTVEDITNVGFHLTHGFSAFEHLIGVAQNDVENKSWDKYLTAVGAPKITE